MNEPLTLDELESRHILSTLNIVSWNKSKAAVILGVERLTLDRKIKRYEAVPTRHYLDGRLGRIEKSLTVRLERKFWFFGYGLNSLKA